jgi:hypothetical protein
MVFGRGVVYVAGQEIATEVLERNGRHEGTRTPDLYRVNSLPDVKPDDTE